jgi:outer membrane protein assembly factor BamB
MDRWLLSWPATCFWLGCALVVLSIEGSAAAQPIGRAQVVRPPIVRQILRKERPEDGEADDEVIDGVFLPPDRSAKRRLETAKEMTESRRYGEAVRYLGSLLESSEDYFFKTEPTDTVFQSLKAEAGRLIGSLPAEGRESYELQFGAKARRMLEEAAGANDFVELAEVSRRFFYTQAGGEAALLLARNHLDHERPLAAGLLLERLRESTDGGQRFEPMLSLYLATAWLRAGMPEKAQVVLLDLKRQRPQAELRIGGKPTKLFNDDSHALTWLEDKTGGRHETRSAETGDDWLMYRGDARRNAAAHGSRPLLNPRWKRLVAHHPDINDKVKELRQAYLDGGIAALPSLHPLAVGNVVLMRNTRGLQAIDFETGKLIWDVEPFSDGAFDQLVSQGSQAQPQMGQPAQGQIHQFLDQRIWDDPAYGTLSSDGEQVFVIEDLGLGPSNRPLVIMPRGQRQAPMANLVRSYNRLTALELKTEGKLKWEVGGPNGQDEPKLAGAFFLGPPLPMQGRLYALAEMRGQEIRLLGLSARTGKLEWSQQICVVEQSIAQEPERRAGGASPSYADGVLVCPTSAGAIVAVDLTTRSLLWGYQYPRGQQAGAGRFNALRMGMVPVTERRTGDRWVDSSVTIADGRVLATPVESEHLYCLNLIDGKLQWKIDRKNNLYVACVDSGHVILVGHNGVTAYSLTELDAKKNMPLEIWSVELSGGSMPTGRGFYSGHSYFLPLSSAEVVEIDLAKGQIVNRAKSRLGEVPGNLICHRGEIISQGPDVVETFSELALLKEHVTAKLDASADDPKSLARLGEIKLDEGKLPEAIELFRRSFELSADDSTRDLLVDSLLEGLRADFPGSRGKAAELEKLIDKEEQRNTYLRLVAVGLKKSGEALDAFDSYIRLLDEPAGKANPEPERSKLEPVGDSLLVRRERWIQAELADLRAHATPDEQRQIDARVAARLQLAVAAKAPPELRRFLKVFGTHPLADEARANLVAALAGNSYMERELLLRRLERSSDETRQHEAVARLAALFDEVRRPDLAVVYYRQLANGLADVTCLDGKTGKQLVEALPADGPLRKMLAPAKPWPAGRVVNKDGGRQLSAPHQQRSFDLNMHGPAGPFFNETNVTLEVQQQTIVGQDGLGNERFRAVLHEPGSRRVYGWNGFNGFNNPTLNYVSVNGNLLLLWMGYQVLAVDTLRAGDAANRVIWTQDLNEQVPGVQVNQGLHQRPVNVPWGLPRFVAQDSYGRMIGGMGPVNFDGVCFQRFRDLICADPLTGEVLWTRKNVPVGSDVFGDEELLFVASPEQGEALVLRALDGELLGTRSVAPLEQRMATFGRNILVWDTKEGRQVVSLRDPWTNQEKWSQSFDAGAKGAIVADEAVGVFEPSGRFVMVRLEDGRKIVEEKLKPEDMLSGIYILGSSTQYLLVTNSPPRAEDVQANVNVQPAPGGLNNPAVNGRVYAFDRQTGKPMWAEPFSVKQQGLVLTQPSEMPLLFFLSHRHTANNVGHETRTSVLCLDKRNGQMVYRNDSIGTVINNFEIIGSRTDDTVALLLPQKTITFRLTNDPPQEKQAQAEKKNFLLTVGELLLRAEQKRQAAAAAGSELDDD